MKKHEHNWKVEYCEKLKDKIRKCIECNKKQQFWRYKDKGGGKK